jgi:hypothetical protein
MLDFIKNHKGPWLVKNNLEKEFLESIVDFEMY